MANNGINLRAELIALLEEEGLGRIGYLRKTSGKGPTSPTGEYEPNDPRYSEGRPYLDYLIKYYRASQNSMELKTATGPIGLQEEVIYIAAKAGTPKPGRADKIVEIEHDDDGNPLVPHRPAKEPISIDSIIEYWGDDNGRTVLYVVKPTRPIRS